MSQNVVSIRRFHEKATRATNDFGERFADAPQHPDIKAVKALLTAWAEETRQAGIVRLLTNVRMWIVIGVLLLVIAVLPLGPKLRSLRPILMIAVTLGLPIALFIKHCIDVEKYLMKALGPNDFQNPMFNYVSGGIFIAEIAKIPATKGKGGNSSDSLLLPTKPDPQVTKPSLVDPNATAGGKKPASSSPEMEIIGFCAYRVWVDDVVDDVDTSGPFLLSKAASSASSNGNANQGRAELRYLYVMPAHRRRGIAALLTETAYEHASQIGYRVLTMVNKQGNSDAAAFLKDRGFRNVETSDLLSLSPFGPTHVWERPVLPKFEGDDDDDDDDDDRDLAMDEDDADDDDGDEGATQQQSRQRRTNATAAAATAAARMGESLLNKFRVGAPLKPIAGSKGTSSTPSVSSTSSSSATKHAHGRGKYYDDDDEEDIDIAVVNHIDDSDDDDGGGSSNRTYRQGAWGTVEGRSAVSGRAHTLASDAFKRAVLAQAQSSSSNISSSSSSSISSSSSSSGNGQQSGQGQKRYIVQGHEEVELNDEQLEQFLKGIQR